MLELAGLFFLFLVAGVVFVAAKLLFKLICLPITVGFWAVKLLFGLLFTVLGGLALLVLLPIGLLALPLLIVAGVFGVLLLPVFLLVKIFT